MHLGASPRVTYLMYTGESGVRIYNIFLDRQKSNVRKRKIRASKEITMGCNYFSERTILPPRYHRERVAQTDKVAQYNKTVILICLNFDA